jgi:hypothetical protein
LVGHVCRKRHSQSWPLDAAKRKHTARLSDRQSLSRHVLHPQVLQAVQQLRGVDLKQQQMKQDFHYLYLLTTLRARRAYGVSPGMCGMVHQRCTKCLAE